MENFAKLLLLSGAVVMAVGGLMLLASKAGIGRLPGDLQFGGRNWRIFVPLGTSIVVSIILTVVLSLLSRFR